MAKRLAGWMSPWQTGLLSGISDWGATQDKFNLINAQNQGRIQAYQAKYGAMQNTQALKMQNDALMKKIAMDQKQRSYTVNQTGADGNPYTVSYINTFNPDSGTYEPKEVGRVPMKDPEAMQANREQAISDRQTAQLGAMQDRADTRQAAIDSRLDKRDADAQAKQAAAEQSAKADKLDSKVEKDMDKFDAADPSEQATLLKSVGISPTVSKTTPGMIYGTNTSDVPNPDARSAYEAAVTAKHAKTMGIKPTADSGAATTTSGDASSAPAVTPNGQPILKKDGQLYVRDKDGKPVPYTPDASGNAQGVPLAMDDQSDAASPTAAPSSDDSGEDDADNQQGLLASSEEPDESQIGSPESDQEDEEDDAQQDQQTQGLLA